MEGERAEPVDDQDGPSKDVKTPARVSLTESRIQCMPEVKAEVFNMADTATIYEEFAWY